MNISENIGRQVLVLSNEDAPHLEGRMGVCADVENQDGDIMYLIGVEGELDEWMMEDEIEFKSEVFECSI